MKHKNVYTVHEENSHRFYKVPKELFINEKYKGLNSDAKLLYALLLDRKELSRKNKWVNEYDQVYLLYSRENIADMLDVSIRTVQRVFKQLISCGLIIEERQGLNKPNRIYICRLQHQETQGHAKLAHQEVPNSHASETELSETEKIKRNTIKNSGRVLNYYNDIYKDKFNKEHPTLRVDQLSNIELLIDEYENEHSIIDEDWFRSIDEHFSNLPDNNNGNVLYMFTGDVYSSPLLRLLDVK